jgi:hypothetical protein
MCNDAEELLLSQQYALKLYEQTSLQSCNSTSREKTSNGNNQTTSNSSSRSLQIAKSVIKILMKEMPNYAEILDISDIWLEELKKFVGSNDLTTEDVKTSISFDISGKSLCLKHEIDGIRTFDVVIQFYMRVKHYKSIVLDLRQFEAECEFLANLCPLSISLYLKVGKDIDIGIGIDKPIDIKRTLEFLGRCTDFRTVEEWISLNNHPIATFCYFDLVKKARHINFCIFDGLRLQNIDKALSLLENIGAHVSEEIIQLLRKNNTDEINCCMEVWGDQINSVSIEIKSEDVGECVFSVIEAGCDYEKWTTFHNLVQPGFLAVELTPNGYSLKKVSYL